MMQSRGSEVFVYAVPRVSRCTASLFASFPRDTIARQGLVYFAAAQVFSRGEFISVSEQKKISFCLIRFLGQKFSYLSQ